MENIWIIAIAFTIFIILCVFFYKSLRSYVKSAYGKRWSNHLGSNVYVWQGSIFLSTGGTFLIMYFLKWSNVLIF